MIEQILIAIGFGLLFGIFTGLIPGIHINLVSIVLLTFSPFFLQYTTVVVLISFIISMSVTHTFTDFIASVYLGAPDPDTALAMLPGHKLLFEGKAYEAVRLTVEGSLLCLIVMSGLIPFLVFVVPIIFEVSSSAIPYLLIGISGYMILKESSFEKRLWSFLVYMLAGVLGLIVLTMKTVEQPLFHLLSGLFGVSMLVMSLTEKTSLPAQKKTETIHVNFLEEGKAVSASVFSGGLLSIFPGLGPAQAAILASQFYRSISDYTYLIVVGGINTVSMIMSLVTLFAINKARNGSIVAVQELVPSFSWEFLVLAIGVALVAGGCAAIITLLLSHAFSSLMNKINYRFLSVGIIGFIFILSFYFAGFLGWVILATSTAIGILPAIKNVGRNHAMGVLLLPVILYFLL